MTTTEDPITGLRADLQDTATVYRVRKELRPLIADLVDDLGRDPLGDAETDSRVQALDAALRSARTLEGRAARSRLRTMLGTPVRSSQ